MPEAVAVEGVAIVPQAFVSKPPLKLVVAGVKVKAPTWTVDTPATEQLATLPRPVVVVRPPLLSTDPVNGRGPWSPLSKLPLSLMSIAPLVSEALVLMVTLPAVATRLRPLSVPSLRKAKSPPIPVLLVKLNTEVFCFLKTPLMADPTVDKVAWRLMMCPNDATPAEIEPQEQSKPWVPPHVISVN